MILILERVSGRAGKLEAAMKPTAMQCTSAGFCGGPWRASEGRMGSSVRFRFDLGGDFAAEGTTGGRGGFSRGYVPGTQ